MNTLNFYIQLAIIIFGIMNPFSIWIVFSLVVMLYWWFMFNNSNPDIYEISGVNWMKQKFKNSPISKITDDLTEE